LLELLSLLSNFPSVTEIMLEEGALDFLIEYVKSNKSLEKSTIAKVMKTISDLT